MQKLVEFILAAIAGKRQFLCFFWAGDRSAAHLYCTGSMIAGSSFLGLLTRVLMRQAFMRSAG